MFTNHCIDGERPLLIIGAGPIGLATAAKCVAAGLDFCLVEAGGAAASAVAGWSHVRLFSPWSECLDDDACLLLRKAGRIPPAGADFPSGKDLIADYLQPLSKLPGIAARSTYRSQVTQIALLDERRGGFRITTNGDREYLAGAVIDASGTWATPRTLPLQGGIERSRRIFYRVPDVAQRSVRETLAGRRVAIIGSGHSGMTLLLQLKEITGSGELVWIRRGAISHSGAPISPGSARLELEQRAEQAASGPGVRIIDGATIAALRETEASVEMAGHTDSGSEFTLEADYVFATLGFDPDHAFASGLRLDLDPALAAPAGLADLIDPKKHSCNTVPAHGWRELAHPEAGYFILGSKSYGRAPNFALSTGYAQIDSVLAHLAPAKFRAKTVARACSPCVARCA